MKKMNWFIYGAIAVILAVGWFTYQKVTDDTYEGMSIIPEQHKDIPLFDGLEPTEHEYVMEGKYLKEIYEFYQKELPKHGWKVNYAQNNFEDQNNVAGFMTSWRKNGLEWELSIRGGYSELNNHTKVVFDKHPIYHSTTWIDEVPDIICIYKEPSDESCLKITDKAKIEGIVGFINHAIDWDEKASPREKASIVVIGDMEIKVLYENDKEVYFQSDKGIKLMKPEPEFFELTNLEQ